MAQSYEDSLLNILNIESEGIDQKEATFLLGEYLVQRNPELAETYADQLLEMTASFSDSNEWARINYIHAASHRWQGNYTTALQYYQANYDYFKSHDNREQIARSSTKIGSINTFLGNNVLAQRHLLESAQIYEDIGTPHQKASISNSLAGFYLNIDQLDKSKEQYIMALTEFTSLNDSAGMASANANLGSVYSELGEYDKAEAHLLAQKGLNSVFPTEREMGFYHDFMGVLRQKQGRLDEAYKQHLIALEIRKNLSSTYNLCESRLNVGEVLIKLGRQQEAIKHLEDVLNYKEHHSLNQENAAHELLSQAYEKMGDYKDALLSYQSFKLIADSIYNESSIQIIAEKDAQYKKKEQDTQIKILNQEKEIARQRANKSKTVILAGIIGLIVISLSSFFVFLLYRKVKKQKDVISDTLDEKETLLREIHHRVKNNLQVISSLLSLQSRYIQDSKAQEAVSEGQNRVKSMALIHQKLYQDSSLMGVEALDYIQSLTETLKSTYSLNTDKIEIDYEVDNITIDVDTIIPIGLILNELISNAFKHAFPDNQEGKVSISLKEENNRLNLSVEDDGVGTPDNVKTSDSFGMRMIQSLARKLEADVDFQSNNGAKAFISMSNYKLV